MVETPARKLAVLVHADVAGSTALVQANESLAHERIRDIFQEFAKKISGYGGTAHEVRGDALVAEFARASDAVSASLSFQSENRARNQSVTDGIRPVVRIGIAIGEVVVADNTVTGEGIVLAQRLEQLSEPGGICIQDAAYQTIPRRLPFHFRTLGDCDLKGFNEPVRAYIVELTPGAEIPQAEGPQVDVQTPDLQSSGLPDRPSIAVLPFVNVSSDPEQEFLADGITEDIITNLSRFRDLFVIARNSSFVYKGAAVKIQDVSRELGVRYILEGSVQRSNDRVRINAQLVDGLSGNQLWTERYQRSMDDIFTLQDEVVELIVGSLASGYGGRLRKAWQRRESENPKAFDSFMRGIDLFDSFSREDIHRSMAYFEEAVKLDPNYGKAYSKIAWRHLFDAIYGWSDDAEASMAKALEVVERGLAREDSEPWLHWVLGAYYVYNLKHDWGLSHFERALDLNPNDADVLNDVALYSSYAGKAEQGVALAEQSIRLNPHHPDYYLIQFGQVLFDAGRYEEAISTISRSREADTMLSWLYLAASHAAMGNPEGAQEAISRALSHDPAATVEKWTRPYAAPYRNPEDLDVFRRNLLKAGLPA